MIYQIVLKISGEELVIEYCYDYSDIDNPFIMILSIKKEGVEFLDIILSLDSESATFLENIEKRTEYEISKYPGKVVELIDTSI